MMRFDDLRIVIAHCRRPNDYVRVANILSIVPFSEIDTHLLQTIRHIRTFRVRT